MRSGISIFIAVLLATGIAAAAPEIANVAGPVNHWEPFLVFGEGFDEPESTIIAWAPKGHQDARDLLPQILSGGLPQPPEEPPDGKRDRSLRARAEVVAPGVGSGHARGGCGPLGS